MRVTTLLWKRNISPLQQISVESKDSLQQEKHTTALIINSCNQYDIEFVVQNSLLDFTELLPPTIKETETHFLPEDSFPFCCSYNMPTVIRKTITRNTGILQEPATEAVKTQGWVLFKFLVGFF